MLILLSPAKTLDFTSPSESNICTEPEFLEFSKVRGNDLSTPRPEFGFEGLKDGDKWCICAGRWTEALEAGKAPKIFLKATHQKMLSMVQIEVLEKYALDLK